MTEDEWLTCTDPKPMLEFVRDSAGERKLRLFACACYRRIWNATADEASRRAVALAEVAADGGTDASELAAAGREAVAEADAAYDRCDHLRGDGGYCAAICTDSFEQTDGIDALDGTYGAHQCAELAAYVAARAAIGRDGRMVESRRFLLRRPNAWETLVEERVAQASLLRDIFGNPFRPITSKPAWVTPAVASLAQSIYDERAFDRMSELADALEKSGCRDADILEHCRGPEPHVRGCWVVDLLLGKK